MALVHHPNVGTIVICDFSGIEPEMIKRRPAIVVSPRFRVRDGLCTVVPLSTTPPNPVMPYHHQIYMNPTLPPPFDAMIQWVKADMFATVSFKRLNLPYLKRDGNGKRQYEVRMISEEDLRKVRACMLEAVALGYLTQHL